MLKLAPSIVHVASAAAFAFSTCCCASNGLVSQAPSDDGSITPERALTIELSRTADSEASTSMDDVPDYDDIELDVVDAGDGAIEGAIVVVTMPPSSWTATDALGHAHLRIPSSLGLERLELTASADGYVTRYVSVPAGQSPIRVQLEPGIRFSVDVRFPPDFPKGEVATVRFFQRIDGYEQQLLAEDVKVAPGESCESPFVLADTFVSIVVETESPRSASLVFTPWPDANYLIDL